MEYAKEYAKGYADYYAYYDKGYAEKNDSVSEIIRIKSMNTVHIPTVHIPIPRVSGPKLSDEFELLSDLFFPPIFVSADY